MCICLTYPRAYTPAAGAAMATAFIPSLPRTCSAAEQCYELPAPGLWLSADHLQRDSGSALLCYCERETGQKWTALWTSGAAGRQWALSVSLWEPQGWPNRPQAHFLPRQFPMARLLELCPLLKAHCLLSAAWHAEFLLQRVEYPFTCLTGTFLLLEIGHWVCAGQLLGICTPVRVALCRQMTPFLEEASRELCHCLVLWMLMKLPS